MKINNKKVTNISLAGKIVTQIKDVLTGQILYKKEDEEKDYFSISPIDGGPAVLTINVPRTGGTYLETIEYSEDQKSWNTQALVKGANTIEFNDKLFLRSSIGHLGNTSATTSHKINVDVPFNAGGNIMSLLYGKDFEDKTSFDEDFPFSFLFYQSNIVNANELSLPATELTNSAYRGMFRGCSSLVTAPDLPATTLGEYCYYYMFYNCSLTSAPVLPATEMKNYCYGYMFSGCPISSAPALPAMELDDYCYEAMFSSCSKLTSAPDLPATELTSGCYRTMFSSCSKLTSAPDLPATELTSGCYYYMFNGCSSLVTAPDLPATILPNDCYFGMFNGCSSLNYIKAGFIEINSAATTNWVNNVAASGTFVKNPDATWENVYGAGLIPTGWKVEVPFFIENISDATAQATFKRINTAPYLTMSYSTDKGQTWNPIMMDNDYTFNIDPNSKIYLKGTNTELGNWDGSKVNHWTIDAAQENTINVGGDLSMLTNRKNLSGTNCCYYGLFRRSKVNSIRKLNFDFDVLGESSFQEFARYSSIIEAPKLLKVNTMTASSFNFGFAECPKLTTPMNIEIENFEGNAFYSLYSNSEKLTSTGNISIKNIKNAGCERMFYHCTGLIETGDVYFGGSGNYAAKDMFSNCTGLVDASKIVIELGAGTQSCQSMFDYCINMTTSPIQLITDRLGQEAYKFMFRNCYKLTQSPYIRYSTIGPNSLVQMFDGCSSLNSMKVDIMNNPGSNAANWVRGVAATGTFYKSEDNFKFSERGVNGIPEGWTIETYYEN